MKRKAYYGLLCALLISACAACGSQNDDVKEIQPVSEVESVVEKESSKEAASEDSISEGSSSEEAISEEVSSEAVKSEEEPAVQETISEEQALNAIVNYCCIGNPDLKAIVDEGQYSVYWEVVSADDKEIVVLYRSYTAAQVRYYIDRNTGSTYVTEFVPGITDEEERTGEEFNVREYFS